MKRNESVVFERKVPKFLSKFKKEIESPDFGRKAQAAEDNWRKGGVASSVNEDYEDALKHGTIVPAEEALPTHAKRKKQKVCFDEFITKSKGKHFTATEKTFEARGAESGTEHEEEDNARGMDYITNKIEKGKRQGIKRKGKGKKVNNASLLSFSVADDDEATE